MKHVLKKSALAAAALLSITAAQADIVSFSEAIDTTNAPFAPVFGHLDGFTIGKFSFSTFSNSSTRVAGDFVAGLIDGADSGNICAGLICPTTGVAGNYLGVVNDGFIAISSNDPLNPLISIAGWASGFIGVSGDAYSATRSGRVIVIGVRPNGSAISTSGNLGLPVAGAFGWSSFATSATFAAEQFSFLQIYGAYCPSGATACNSFIDNKAQFGLDTLNIAAVPEPATYGLMGLGLLGVAAIARRRRSV